MSDIVGWNQFALQLASEFGEDFVRDFEQSIVNEVRAEQELAFSRQRQIAAATARLEEHYFDGLGELHMRVDPEVFWHWVRREGREIWNDPDFIKAFKRDNPDVRVITKARKTIVKRP